MFREVFVSFPFEILLGYGAMAVICERCGTDVVTPGGRLCLKCEEGPARTPADGLDELDSEDSPDGSSEDKLDP